jgi:hypothetical protein
MFPEDKRVTGLVSVNALIGSRKPTGAWFTDTRSPGRTVPVPVSPSRRFETSSGGARTSSFGRAITIPSTLNQRQILAGLRQRSQTSSARPGEYPTGSVRLSSHSATRRHFKSVRSSRTSLPHIENSLVAAGFSVEHFDSLHYERTMSEPMSATDAIRTPMANQAESQCHCATTRSSERKEEERRRNPEESTETT